MVNIKTSKKAYAPIGVEIFSETQEKIAVSIVAQMIKLKRGSLMA
jgi:xanthine/CO dehydrogenase XdhC/CoxF family maturation factor